MTGYTVYAHNLSRFDIIFLFKFLGDLAINKGYKVDPIIKDDQIISITIKNNKGVKLVLRDSLLILKDSLEKLSNIFDCTNVKGIEPVRQKKNIFFFLKKFILKNYQIKKNIFLILVFLITIKK